MRLSELASLCLLSTPGPYPPQRQLEVLRRAGVVDADETLDQAAGRSETGREDPDIAERVVAAVLKLCDTRYFERNGLLVPTTSREATISSVKAYRSYGPDLMLRALRNEDARVKPPGKRWLQRRLLALWLLGVTLKLSTVPVAGLAWFIFAVSGWEPRGAPGVIGGALLGAVGYILAAVFVPLVVVSVALDDNAAQCPPSAVRYILVLCAWSIPFVVFVPAVVLVPMAFLIRSI